MFLLTTATQTPSSLSSINLYTRNANNDPSILDNIRSNQLYDIFNMVYFLVADYSKIFRIVSTVLNNEFV